MLAGLLANLLLSGSQTNPETGKRNWSSGQFWGDVGKSMIPAGGGQMFNQAQGNQMAEAAPDCPDPNGIHGPGVKMVPGGYGGSVWMCPVCGYRMPRSSQNAFGNFLGG